MPGAGEQLYLLRAGVNIAAIPRRKGINETKNFPLACKQSLSGGGTIDT